MKIKLLLLALLAALYVTGQNTGVHSYAIDLTHVVEDRVKVTVDASLVQLSNPKDNQYKFHFPATIPGTYATLDYGRFIQDFKAYNTGGQPLKVKHKGQYLHYLWQTRAHRILGR
jgi:predicted metalloprotease with PDZ domain